jgi:hypothetical protein
VFRREGLRAQQHANFGGAARRGAIGERSILAQVPARLEDEATKATGTQLLVGLDGCEVRLWGPSAFVRPRVPCVPCVSRLPPVSFYRYRVQYPVPVKPPRVCP